MKESSLVAPPAHDHILEDCRKGSSASFPRLQYSRCIQRPRQCLRRSGFSLCRILVDQSCAIIGLWRFRNAASTQPTYVFARSPFELLHQPSAADSGNLAVQTPLLIGSCSYTFSTRSAHYLPDLFAVSGRPASSAKCPATIALSVQGLPLLGWHLPATV